VENNIVNNLDNTRENHTMIVNKEISYDFENFNSRQFPQIVQITITNVCDMSCSHCPHSSYKKEAGYTPKFMDMSIYKKIVDEMKDYKDSTLRIFGWGEALLHKDITNMIEYASNNGVFTNLITNGLQLNAKKSTELINAGLDVLEVSIDAYTKETYSKTRGSERNFDIVKNNVKTFISLREQLSGHAYVNVSIIDQPLAKPEVEQFKKYWSEISDDVILRKFHDFMGYAKDKDHITLPKRHPCRCLWARFNITSDGLVSVCFNDWHNKSIIADIKDENTTIKNVWQGKLYSELRQSHLDGNPKGICKNCNDWISASWEMPYERMLEKSKLTINQRKELKK